MGAQFARDHATTDLLDAGLVSAARPNALTWRVIHFAAAGDDERARQVARGAVADAHRRADRKRAIDLAERLERWLAR